MWTPLIVDPGPLVAEANAKDPDHERVCDFFDNHDGLRITTPHVIAETGWLLRKQIGITAEVALYRAIAHKELHIESLTAGDFLRVAELLEIYRDIQLDAADASLIAISERLQQSVIVTLDLRDFRIVRPKHTEAFLLPPEDRIRNSLAE